MTDKERSNLVFTVGEFSSYSVRADDVRIEPPLPSGLEFSDMELKGKPLHPMPRTKFEFFLSQRCSTSFHIEILPATMSQFVVPTGKLQGKAVGGMVVWNQWMYCAVDNQIRRAHVKTGKVEVVIGDTKGRPGCADDGLPGLKSMLNNPMGLAVCDESATLFICDAGNHRVCAYDIQKDKLTTLAGTGHSATSSVQKGVKNDVVSPHGCCYRDGCVFVTAPGSPCVRCIDVGTGTVTTYAGTLTFGRKKPLIVNPGALCADSRYLYVCDVGSHRILRIDRNSRAIESYAGGGKSTTDGCAASDLQLDSPRQVIRTPGLLLILTIGPQPLWAVDMRTNQCYAYGDDGTKGTGAKLKPSDFASLCSFRQGNSILLNDVRNTRIVSIPVAVRPAVRKRKLRPSAIDVPEESPRKRLAHNTLASLVPNCNVSDNSAEGHDRSSRRSCGRSSRRSSGRSSKRSGRSSKRGKRSKGNQLLLDESTEDNNLPSSTGVSSDNSMTLPDSPEVAPLSLDDALAECSSVAQELMGRVSGALEDLKKPPPTPLPVEQQQPIHNIPPPDQDSLKSGHLKGFRWARNFDAEAPFPVDGSFVHEDSYAQQALRLAPWMKPDSDTLQRMCSSTKDEEQLCARIRRISEKVGNQAEFYPKALLERQKRTRDMLTWYQERAMEVYDTSMQVQDQNIAATSSAKEIYQNCRKECTENITKYGRFANKCSKALAKMDRNIFVVGTGLKQKEKEMEEQNHAHIKRIGDITEQIRRLADEAMDRARSVTESTNKYRESCNALHSLQHSSSKEREFLTGSCIQYDELLDRWANGVKHLDSFQDWYTQCSEEVLEEAKLLTTTKIGEYIRRHDLLHNALQEDARWLYNRYANYTRQTDKDWRSLQEEGNILRCADFEEATHVQRQSSKLQKQSKVMRAKSTSLRDFMVKIKKEAEEFEAFVREKFPDKRRSCLEDEEFVASFFPSRCSEEVETTIVEQIPYAHTPHPPRAKRRQSVQKDRSSPVARKRVRRCSNHNVRRTPPRNKVARVWANDPSPKKSHRGRALRETHDKSRVLRPLRSPKAYPGRIPLGILDMENTPNR